MFLSFCVWDDFFLQFFKQFGFLGILGPTGIFLLCFLVSEQLPPVIIATKSLSLYRVQFSYQIILMKGCIFFKFLQGFILQNTNNFQVYSTLTLKLK